MNHKFENFCFDFSKSLKQPNGVLHLTTIGTVRTVVMHAPELCLDEQGPQNGDDYDEDDSDDNGGDSALSRGFTLPPSVVHLKQRNREHKRLQRFGQNSHLVLIGCITLRAGDAIVGRDYLFRCDEAPL